MRCDLNATILAAYLDGELPADQAPAVHEHLASCTRCAAEIAELVRLKRQLRPAQNHFVPSAEFRRRMRRQMTPVRPARRWLGWPVAGVGAFAMAMLCLGWLYLPDWSNPLPDQWNEVADLHVEALASVNPYDVVSSDRHTVKPWFQGRIPFTFNVPEFAGTDYTLLGARLVYLHQRPGAELIVGLRQHKISVFIFQDSAEMTSPFVFSDAVRQSHGFSVETWHTHELRFFAIGDADAGGVGKLANSFRQIND